MIGDIEQAQKSLLNYRYVLKRYGFIPEFFDISNNNVKRNGNPLRPEFTESLFYLYKATKDPYLLTIGAEVIEAIEYSARTECGYATIKNVDDHTIEDRMESFFLAETLKYLYLLFDDSNFIHNEGSKGVVIDHGNKKCVIDAGGYIFNTEAHPIDASILDCCSSKSRDFSDIIDKLDLYELIGLGSDSSDTHYHSNSKSNFNKHDSEPTVSIQPSSDVSFKSRNNVDQFSATFDIENVESTLPSITPTLDAAFQLDMDLSSHDDVIESPASINEDFVNKFDFSAVQTDNQPWTPITSPYGQSRSTSREPANTQYCDISKHNNCPSLETPEIITAAPSQQHHFRHSIPPDLNMSDFILQYEDDELSPSSFQDQDYDHYQEPAQSPSYSNYTEPSHEILLCFPLPFLSPFTKYGQVLIRSEI